MLILPWLLTLLACYHGHLAVDQGYGRGCAPVLTGVFEPVARVTLYLTDKNGLGTWFGAA